MRTDLWTREQTIIALNLYCKIPFGKAHSRNPDVQKVAQLIGRSPGAVARKLGNFGSLDPELKKRDIKGLENRSALDEQIWNEFQDAPERLAYESELLIANRRQIALEISSEIDIEGLPKEGKEREVMVRTRINQNFFRKAVLSSYDFCCCITGLNNPTLLVAGHINKWSEDVKNRMNPKNGLSLNRLHDSAFENGLITITPEYKIKVSSILKSDTKNAAIKEYFLKYDNQPIIEPKKFRPNKEFLEIHNNTRFIK